MIVMSNIHSNVYYYILWLLVITIIIKMTSPKKIILKIVVKKDHLIYLKIKVAEKKMIFLYVV